MYHSARHNPTSTFFLSSVLLPTVHSSIIHICTAVITIAMPSPSSPLPNLNPDRQHGPDLVAPSHPVPESTRADDHLDPESGASPSQTTPIHPDMHRSPDLEEQDIDLPSHRFDDDIENDDGHVTPPATPTVPPASGDISDGPDFQTPAVSSKPPDGPRTPADVSAMKPRTLPADNQNPNPHPGNYRTRAANTDPADDASDMLSMLTRAPQSVSKILSDWLAQLTINGPVSVASVLSLVVAIGRPIGPHAQQHLVSSDMIVANQPTVVVPSFSSILSADPNARVPILSKDAQSKRLRKAYEEFWSHLPADASNVVVFDTDCVETLLSWLEPMVCSPSRGLRTAACYAVYRMVDGFITVRIRLQRDIASLQRQLSSEKIRHGAATSTPSKSPGRPREKPLSAKGKELARKVEELTANNNELNELCDKVFRAVLILKYRDVSPDIRSMSVRALGGWISTFPRQFLDDIHLKYVGWLLYDKDPSVRKTTLEVVSSILSKKELQRGLGSFLSRFSARIVEMSRDKDDAVAVSAINVLTRLEPQGLLDQKSCDTVCAIVSEETHIDIRRAAGEFLSRMIIRQSSSEHPPTPGGKVSSKPPSQRGRRAVAVRALEKLGEVPSTDVSREHIKQFLSVVSQGKSEHARVLAVDAVWDHLPALRCWDAFTSFLVDRSTPASTGTPNSSRASSRRSTATSSARSSEGCLNDDEKVSLCEILLASATHVSGKGDAVRAKLIAQSESEGVETLSQNFTRYMVQELPKILTHFQADGNVMKFLVQLPRHFRVEALAQESFKPHLKSLLNRLVDALTRHSGESGVAVTCSGTFRSLLFDDNPLKTSAMAILQLACKKATKEFCVSVLSGLIDIEPETVRASVLRLRVLTELVEPSVSILDPLLKLLRHQIEKIGNTNLSDEATCDALRTIVGLAVWSLLKIQSRLSSIDTSDTSFSTILESNDIMDAEKRGAEVISHLLEVCACESMSSSVKTVSLQGLLTTMTLCFGIERMVLERLEKDGLDSDSAISRLRNEMDFLSLRARRDVLAETVKQCFLELIDDEFTSAKAQLRSRGRGRAANLAGHNDSALKHCTGALLQASVQSIISKEICHLPLLGLLLKGKRGRHENDDGDFSVVDICRRYYELRIMRGSIITEEEIRVLVDCGSIERKQERSLITSRDMAEVLVSFRRRDTERNAVSLHIFRVLVDAILGEDDVATIVGGVRILRNVGTGLLGHLTEEGAQSARQKLRMVEEFLKKDWIVEECGEVEASVEGLVKALETIKEHDSNQSPKINLNGTRKGLKRVDGSDDVEEGISSDVEEGEGVSNDHVTAEPRDQPANTGLRRSSRRASRVDYSALDESEDNNGEAGQTEVNGEGSVEYHEKNDSEREGDAIQASTAPEPTTNAEITVSIEAAESGIEAQPGGSDALSPRTLLAAGSDTFGENSTENSGQETQLQKHDGTSKSSRVTRGRGKKRSGVISHNTTNSDAGLNSDHIANSASNGSGNTGEVGESTRDVGEGQDAESRNNSRNPSTPPRRSKRRRSGEPEEIAEDSASEGKANGIKRLRTPRGSHARHSDSATENDASLAEEVSNGRNGGYGLRTRSATKAPKESDVAKVETTPSKPTVRRRKRHHW